MTDAARTVGIVLAAGGAMRFGGGKLLAALEGRPLIAHAVEAAIASGLGRVLVVVGADADAMEAAVRDAAHAASELRIVRNPRWRSGIASSIRAGLAMATAAFGDAEAALILLGDQPRVSPAVVAALLAASPDPDRPFVAPRYAGAPVPNPVLVRRAAWRLADGLSGDRGFGPLLAARPELVVRVDVPGDLADVDTPADLTRLGGAR